MDIKKIKSEAEEKINNEREALVRDYYRQLMLDKENITNAYKEKMKKIEDQIAMLDAGDFRVGYFMERNELSVISTSK